nr:MAG TPA: hypothetical protein [Caudoviricetes sp.]
MAEYLTNDTDLKKVADAIRTKGGTSAALSYPDEYVSAINAITTGTGLKIVVSATTGATVTATKGELSVSAVSTDGSCTLIVPEAGTWSVKATLGGQTSDMKSISFVDSYAVMLTFFSATITVNIDSGATVTLEKDGTTIATKTSNGAAVFTVAETGAYTVTAAKNGQTTSDSVNVVSGTTSYTLTLSFLKEHFEANTWASIITSCHNNAVPDTWAVGDQKLMTIGGKDYLIDIIGKNHDVYAGGEEGVAPLTFQMHDCYADVKQMDSSNYTRAWSNCDMRQKYLPDILALMPSEVQSGIREVKKLTSAAGQNTAIEQTEDKLFLLSEIEIFGTVKQSKQSEGTQYNYYKAGNSKVKKRGSTAYSWWERSPYKSIYSNFCRVYTDGSSDYYEKNRALGVAFGFCF